MAWKRSSPYYLSFVPACLLSVMMIVCNYLPGGQFAGQIALHDSLEYTLENKIVAMEGGNLKK